jgi:hypothetical protein
MNRRYVYPALAALVLAALAALVAGYAGYEAGFARGVLENATFVRPEAAPGGALPYYYAWPFFGPGFGWGPAGGVVWTIGFFIRCLIPVFIFLVFLSILRAMFWGPWRRHRGWGRMSWDPETGVPPPFEAWHRRAHEASAGAEPDSPA